MGGSIEPGRRLIVPFGRSRAVGFALGPDDGLPPKGLRDIAALLDDGPLFDAPLLKLLDWAARYYRHPLGEVLRAALPPALSGLDTPSTSPASRALAEWVALTESGMSASASPRGTRMKALLDYLRAAPEAGVPLEELFAALPSSSSRESLRRLIDQGLCRTWLADRQAAPINQHIAGQSSPVHPTSEQSSALDAIHEALDAGRFAPFLLHGVTGSGKTEVYLRAIERALSLDLGALVLVPEIALTPQLVGRFRARFGEKVALLHSGLRDTERLAEWRRLREGRAPLAVGVRSAIFAPVQRLGMVIVDEEHDGSFKQDDGFRYSARDLAVVRAQHQACPVILGSATPSLETLHNAQTGRYALLRLDHRVDDRPMPAVKLIDLRASHGHIAAAFPQLAGRIRMRAEEERVKQVAEPAVDYGSSVPRATQPVSACARAEDLPRAQAPLFSPELEAAIEATLDRGRQTILFLNRRGTSTYHLCLSCGQSLTCPNCAVSLTHHQLRDELLCHYCGERCPLPERCPTCGGRIERLGMGTEQVESELSRLFPSARVERLDRDTAARPDELTARLSAFARGDRDILIGTQMVAKGHDFPGVLLVGVLLADLALNLPDFRASERTFQLLTQVAGRAGRGQEPGEVLVQTFLPESPAVARVVGHDFEGFAARELAIRKAFHYPPFCRLMTCRLDGRDPRATAEAAHQLRRAAEEAIRRSTDALRLLGPAPAPISKLKGRVRWQMLFKGPTARSLVPVASAIEQETARLKGDVRVSIDVDSLSML
jgi:primosomal protein N' (replication factor Y)